VGATVTSETWLCGCALGDASRSALAVFLAAGRFGGVRDLIVSIGNGFAFSVAITADGLAHTRSVVGKGRQSTAWVVTT
jgi:hypothetical protein